MQRRDFLAGGLAVGAALATPQVLADAGDRERASAAAGSAGTAVSVPDGTSYARLVNADFLFYPGGRGVKLRLVRVIDATRASSPQVRQFSLVFVGGSHMLKSGTYDVDAPGLPRQRMTVEHVQTQEGAALYRADFALL